MTPETKVLLFAAATMAFAYVAVYPRLRTKTLNRLMQLDLVLTPLLLVTVGFVYAGTNTQFSLVVFTVPWWAYTILCASLVEVPLFLWFCKRWNIDLIPPPK